MSLQQESSLKGNQKNFKSNFLHKIFEEKITIGCGQKDALIYNGTTFINYQKNKKLIKKIILKMKFLANAKQTMQH